MMSTTMKRRRGSARTAALPARPWWRRSRWPAGLAQEIVVTGNSRVDAETIRSYVTGTASGSLEEARRNLLSTGMFSDVRIARSGGNGSSAFAKTRHQPRRLRGQHRIKKEVLEGEVQAKARGPFSQAIIRPTWSGCARSSGAPAAATRDHGRVVDLPNGKIDVVYTIMKAARPASGDPVHRQ